MIKLLLFLTVLTLGSGSAFAAENCFRLSMDGQTWSKTAEVICVNKSSTGKSEITLKVMSFFNQQVIARYELDLITQCKGLDCNNDSFGVSNPSNSIFNNLRIEFNGVRSSSKEAGTVKIGANEFFYESL